ncbi:uncharacterized protein LOC111049209 isoform X1 [Nilaparvata lugens]|uniref:uncharacterized protein LOC111049209 isoform X1 n=1 Tax=Nilaparvata lugens TaxID=108931 RepID=UPI00193D8C9A|nr:uncharacterized protein LOC111049209 isoform X1 [Nilaparvata lugens]
MAVSLKVEEGGSSEVKGASRMERYYRPLLILIGILFMVTLLSCLICIIYQFYNPVPSKAVFTKDDEDDIRIKLYKIQSDYYMNAIDRSEAKFNTIHDNFNSFLKQVSNRKPECTRLLVKRHSPRREIEEFERMTKNNLYHFKQTLNGWIANFNYIDLDGSLDKLINDHEHIYFHEGERSEKDNRNFKRFRDFYDGRIQMLEDCVLSISLKDNARRQHLELRQKINLHEKEIESQFEKFELLNEEVIKSINQLSLDKIYCLRKFPFFWQSIQREIALAEQLLDVLKFKLKKLRYKLLMSEGSVEKIEELVDHEKLFSDKFDEMLNNEIEIHYKTAKSICEEAMKDFETCSFLSHQ